MNLRQLAFYALIAGELVFAAMIVVGGAVYPSYDHLRQYISELGATGTVTGPAVSWWGFLPSGLLITGACLLAAWPMRRNGLALAALLLLAWYAVGLIASAYYPCDFECRHTDTSPSQLMHDLLGGTGYLTAVVGVFLGGLSARSGPSAWLMPLGTVCAVIAFAGLAGVVADIEFGGLAQRALEAAITVFLLAYFRALAKGNIGDR